MKIGVYPFASADNIAGNLNKICGAIEQAASEQVRLLVFHECALCGYPPVETDIEKIDNAGVEAALGRISGLAERYCMYIAVGTVAWRPGNDIIPSSYMMTAAGVWGIMIKWPCGDGIRTISKGASVRGLVPEKGGYMLHMFLGHKGEAVSPTLSDDQGPPDHKSCGKKLNFLYFPLAKRIYFVYNSSSSQEIALSPNGKATDSDSVIFQVRILVALLKTPQQCGTVEGFFFLEKTGSAFA